jgi:phosphatidylinositol alpha-1,6-mannosyltransferase
MTLSLSKNRLLVFSSEFPPGPGGIGTHAYQLSKNLLKLGWDVSVLTMQDYAADTDINQFNASQLFPITRIVRSHNLFSLLFSRLKIFHRVLKEWRPDIVVITGDTLVWLVAICSLILPKNLKWAAIWHGVIPRSFMLRTISAWAFSKPEMVIAVSEYSLQQLYKMGSTPHKAEVITNGADGEFFCPDRSLGLRFKRTLGLPQNSRLLLTVGHMVERKGQDLVIQALPEIIKKYHDVHYLVVGLPTDQARLEDLAESIKVRANVHFLGRLSLNDLLLAYNAADIFILTSRHSSDGQFEGYGIAVVEAAFCGIPSIVSANSGLVEAVQDGITGLVVPENDSGAIASAVDRLLRDISFLTKVGDSARTRAVNEQSWDWVFNQYDIQFKKLISL